MKIENKYLSNSNLLLFITDSIFLFLVIQKLSTFLPVELASYIIALKPLGVSISAAITPFLMNYIGLRSILFFSSLFSSLSAIIVLFLISQENPSPVVIFPLILLQSFMIQSFSLSRECYSKTLGDDNEQRSLQTEIIKSAFNAQIIGPSVSFILINFGFESLGIYFYLILSLWSLFLITKLNKNETTIGVHIFRPLKYLFNKENKPLLDIYIIRTVLFWTPAAISNYLLFPLVQRSFELKLHFTTILYFCTGVGGAVASIIISRFGGRRIFDKDWKIAFVALNLLGISRIMVPLLNTFYYSMVLFFLSGIFLGFNAISTQTIRRKLCTNTQHPEIIGIEVVFGKLIEWLIGTIVSVVIVNKYFSINQTYVFGSALTIVFSIMLLKKSLRKF
jgi:MFS family permease